MFEGLFDLNRDGELDSLEKAMELEYLSSLEEEPEEEEES